MKIIILGDVGASDANVHAFCEAENDLFASDIQYLCSKADVVVLNLEKPLTDRVCPLGKCPPDFSAPTNTINGIKLLNPTVAALANNHIMDQQNQGLQATINVIKENEIKYVGAGNNIQEARRPIIITKKEIRVGIYACCEKEFSFATENAAGANVFDPIVTFDDVSEIKRNCDYLIVLFHAGVEDYPYPTPYQQRVCRRMCEKGADLIVCQHSHIIGCEEKYLNGTIVYGQGNFLLDDIDRESWLSGLMVNIEINKDVRNINYIPVQTINHKAIIHSDREKVLESFNKRSNEIKNLHFVRDSFSKLSEEKISDYLVKLSGKSPFIQRAFRRIGITKHYKRLYSKDVCYRMLDYLYCDSHREAIEYGLNQLIADKGEK